jgi:hypothetical protein
VVASPVIKPKDGKIELVPLKSIETSWLKILTGIMI